MEIDARNLRFGERATLGQILKAKAGAVTVAEARAHCAPQGKAFIVQIIGVTVLSLGMGAFFLPSIFLALVAPPFMILQQRSRVARWQMILPPERDGEQVSLT